MKNFSKILLVALIGIFASFSFANSENKAGDNEKNEMTIMAGPCVHLRTPGQCVSYPTGECFWDHADQRCESYNDNEDRCSWNRSLRRCINSPYNCFWDYDDQRCERRW